MDELMDISYLSEEDIVIDNSASTPYLNQYTQNLTDKVAENMMDYLVFGRDEEIESVILSLLRKSKNSPLLIGDAGVGKTAIVEGLVKRILEKSVPDPLQNVTVRLLELSSLQNSEPGQFIFIFKQIMNEMIQTYGQNLLFIDEIHTIVGAGGNGNSLDAGNVIKPALARGEIQIIGATTLDEYQMYIENDRALERRFQLIEIKEPKPEEAIEILKRAKIGYESFHHVEFSEEAVRQAVLLSTRYIPERFLPDKALDLMDEAATIVSSKRQIEVTEKDIAAALKRKTGIPVTTILKDDSLRLQSIAPGIKKRVKGQDFAVKTVVDAVTIAKAGLQDESKPLASMMFLGSTGVGKTELAKALAEQMFDDENALIRFDMSEYNFEGASIKLIGTDQKKGTLTEAVKHRPYSILLFDEIEKAVPEAHDLLLQIMDDGRLTDGKGRMINFKNTIIILTTNVGADTIQKNYDLKGDVDSLTDREFHQFMYSLEIDLQNYFRPEFLNRIENRVVFKMLEYHVIQEIAEKNLALLNEKLENQNTKLIFDQTLINYLADVGTDKRNGARPLERMIKTKLTAPLAHLLTTLPKTANCREFFVEVEGNPPTEDRPRDRRKLKFIVHEKNN